jgi:limonene-1,2-epoxide hydrolase
MVIERFKELYTDLTPASVELLHDIYSHDITLIDPVGEHLGLEAVRQYFNNLLSDNQQCLFDIHRQILSGESATITWSMNYQHPKLANGRKLTLDGISELRIADDRIVWQRDYYDMGEMIYEHLPLFGTVIRYIKKRMKGNQ